MTAEFVTDVTSTAVAADYERFLRQALKEHAVEVLPIPDIAHGEVVRRALQRRKPFDPEGQKGYRDALIWATIKQAAVDTGDDIAFVSANHRDFADSGKNSGLARALTDELLEAGVAGTVELFAEVKSFVDVSLRPAAEALAELKLRLTGDTTFRAELEQAVELAVENGDIDLSGLDVRLLVDERWAEYELDEAFLHAVSPGVTHIEILSARSLGDDEVVLDLVAEGDADIDFRARRISGGWPLGHPDGFDPDNPPRVIRGTKSRTLRLLAEATYVRSTSRIERVVVTAAFTLDDPELDRIESFRRHRADAPARAEWERRAHIAARRFAREGGYSEPWGESPSSLDFTREDGERLLFSFVADPGMPTWLRGDARRLGLLRRMIGDGPIRTAMVLGAPINAEIATRLAEVLDPPIELYVVDGDDLRPLSEVNEET